MPSVSTTGQLNQDASRVGSRVYAGKKAVILKVYYEGSKSRKFGHVLVAGISKYPRKVTKRMSEERVSRRIRRNCIGYGNYCKHGCYDGKT